MDKTIQKAVDFLKERKDIFEQGAKRQMDLWNGKKPDRQPLLLSCSLDPDEDQSIPSYNTMLTHYDSEKMFISGLKEMLKTAYGGADGVPSIRANMGCGIFPTLFGIKQQLFEDKMPWVKDYISKEELLKMGPEDLKMGDEFKAGIEHMVYMAEWLEDTGCLVYPMDLQGPFDIAHIVYGDTIFYDLYDDPKFIHHLLELCCEAIKIGIEECFRVIPNSDNMIAHYNNLVLPRSVGGLKISEDTSTLLSKEQIEEFVAPYTNKILSYFGGGYIHYCGKNDHLYNEVMNNDLVHGINFGNPEKHDMVQVLNDCAGKGKIYYGGIPNDEGLPIEEYFKKYLKVSRSGDRSMLLLRYSCKKDDRNKVMDVWNRVNEEIV